MSILTLLCVAVTVLWHNTSHSASFSVQVPAYTIQIHKTYQEVTDACQILDNQNRLMPVGGCWAPATRVMHTVAPTSFCDLVVLQTLGHEVMHIVGWSHKNTMKPGIVTGTGCVLGDFTP